MKNLSYSSKLRKFAIVLICLFTAIAVAEYMICAVNYIEKRDAEHKAAMEGKSAPVDEDHRNEIIDITDAVVYNTTDKLYYAETKKGFVLLENITSCEYEETDDDKNNIVDVEYIFSNAGGVERYVKDTDKSKTLDTKELHHIFALGLEPNRYFLLNEKYIERKNENGNFSTEYIFYTKALDASNIISATEALSDVEILPEKDMANETVSEIFPVSDLDLPVAIASTILIVLLGLFVLKSCGHFGTEEIILTSFDKAGYFIHFVVMTAVGGVSWAPFIIFIDHSKWGENLEYIVPSLLFGSVVTMLCIGWFLETTAVRIKANKFWKTTTIYYIYSFIKDPIVRFANWTKEQYLSRKDETNGVDKLMDQTAQIVAGSRDNVDTDGIDSHYLNLVHSINAIASGKSNAISAQMKSDKMRTELITNVSHDIKTPLTSIISYVDLLSKEDLHNENAKEYIEVLSRQSLRLKTLLEDLIEASKASSGVLPVNKEEINIGVIINQVAGEYEERFAKKNLSVITNLPEDIHPVSTDGRHLSRVIGNLFSNIAKYSLEGTRVYVDVSQSDRTYVTIKNTSANQLNISSEELMERFVRGDDSRKTEGSGLGLSIAGSLMTLMSGSLDIDIDGDLFKAIITL